MNVLDNRQFRNFLSPGTGKEMDVAFDGGTLLTPTTFEIMHRDQISPWSHLGIWTIFAHITYSVLLL